MLDLVIPRPNKRVRVTCNSLSSILPNSSSSSSCSRIIMQPADDTKRKENTAYRWWNDHLKRAGWLSFTPHQKYCKSHGFIPVQYSEGLDTTSVRKISNHVIKHGERGKHYAMGWVELYKMVKTYGELEPDTEGLRPGANHKMIADYDGPPLVLLSERGSTAKENVAENSAGSPTKQNKFRRLVLASNLLATKLTENHTNVKLSDKGGTNTKRLLEEASSNNAKRPKPQQQEPQPLTQEEIWEQEGNEALLQGYRESYFTSFGIYPKEPEW